MPTIWLHDHLTNPPRTNSHLKAHMRPILPVQSPFSNSSSSSRKFLRKWILSREFHVTGPTCDIIWYVDLFDNLKLLLPPVKGAARVATRVEVLPDRPDIEIENSRTDWVNFRSGLTLGPTWREVQAALDRPDTINFGYLKGSDRRVRRLGRVGLGSRL